MNPSAVFHSNNEIEQHRRTLRLNPRDANTHALLGIAQLRQRELEHGVASLRRALELNAKAKGIHAILAAALFEMGRYDEAVQAYETALRFQDDADLHQGRAEALRRLGRADEAEPNALRAVALEPANTAFLVTLAAVQHARRNVEDATATLRRVVELDPDNVDARYDYGDMLYRRHRHAEAIVCYQEVLARKPDHANAIRHLGLSEYKLGRMDAAIAHLEQARRLEPDHANTLCDLGGVLHMAGKTSQARPILERAFELDPDNSNVLGALAHAYFALGEWHGALRMARRQLEVAPSPAVNSMMLFILSHCCLDGDELTREHFAFGERWEAPLRSSWQSHPNTRDPLRRLRIGVVSADLFNHAVSRFVAPMFDALKDSTDISIHVYYNNTIEDDMMRAQRASVAAWHQIADLDDDAVERLIRADGIDILIDLSGHSALNRLSLFARKPAPLQATWIGYAGTTGLQGMDYILCDRYLVPEGRYDHQFTEKIVRLPLGAPFLPEANAPAVNELPALRNGFLTFGSFHRTSKLSREVIAQWAKLLHAVPDSRMLLGGLDDGTDAVLLAWFESENIPRERLILRRRASVYEYLLQHYEVDVCLCPFPYTGSTTIGHALWMGVPTLATVGTTNPSHAATVFMAHLGLSTFITENEDTYVKLGVFLSQNVSALAAMRATMRDRFLKSVLGYPGAAAAGLELGLRRMWQRWCADEAPAPIRIVLSDLVPESSQSA
jgi:protein O-GlcNAc transferase